MRDDGVPMSFWETLFFFSGFGELEDVRLNVRVPGPGNRRGSKVTFFKIGQFNRARHELRASYWLWGATMARAFVPDNRGTGS